MFKWILIILVVIGAVSSIRPLRERVMPFLKPVEEKLEPQMQTVSEPYRKMRAGTQARDILHTLAEDHAEGKQLPDDFVGWQKTTGSKPDPWNRWFYLVARHDSVIVGSTGPDGERGSADDVTEGAPWH